MTYTDLHKALPEDVLLLCVSKQRKQEDILRIYAEGCRDFGENRPAELIAKATALHALADLRWHYIGHLQRKAVRRVLPYLSLIHSLDTPELHAEIDRRARSLGRPVPVLLQLHVAAEESKSGFTPDEALAYLRSGAWRPLTFAPLHGVMAMATNTDDVARIESDFHAAADLFRRIRTEFFAHDADFRTLSMGMSDDYPLALAAGSNLLRIGSLLFE